MASVRGMGVALIISMCGSMPLPVAVRRQALLPQGQPLRHAKAVLLVDDGQRQVLELHLLLNHGVVPTTSAASPLATMSSMAVRSFFLPAAHQPGHLAAARQPAAAPASRSFWQSAARPGFRWAPSARIASPHPWRCRPPAETWFCRAHITLQQAVHGLRRPGRRISSPTRCCAAVRSNGSTAMAVRARAATICAGWGAAPPARSRSRSRRDWCCDSCCASNSSAFRRCQAGGCGPPAWTGPHPAWGGAKERLAQIPRALEAILTHKWHEEAPPRRQGV